MAVDRRVRDLQTRPAGDGIVLDLTRVARLHPLHLVGAAALAHWAHDNGRWLDLHGPPPHVAGYAARMRLGEVIEQHCGRHRLPHVRASDRTDSLLELHQVSDAADAGRWASLVRHRVAGLSETAANALHQGLAEIGENVAMHAGTFGYVAAQTFHDSGTIRFAVADAGRGLRATLSARGATNDFQALRLALDGVSRLDGAHGMGLSTTWGRIHDLGGSAVLASDGACVSAANRVFSPADFPGTLFEGSVPAVGDLRSRRP